MKYPKKRISQFIQLHENDCRQINIHIGRKYNYWFIEPNEQPIKLSPDQLPDILKDYCMVDYKLYEKTEF
jgi:hypothetical protein